MIYLSLRQRGFRTMAGVAAHLRPLIPRPEARKCWLDILGRPRGCDQTL